MSLKKKYLIIIDTAPKDLRLDDYFSKFDYQLIQYETLSQLEEGSEIASALLIHDSFLEENLSLISELYQRYPLIPLIVISDLIREDIFVPILESGADDFIVKPVHPRELHARINAIARRIQRAKKDVEQDVLCFDSWRLCLSSRQLFNDKDEELVLSSGEYDLLLAFVRQPQQVLAREFLLKITKSEGLMATDRRIDVQISRLRQKIELDARHPILIKTVRNTGYLFTPSVYSSKKV